MYWMYWLVTCPIDRFQTLSRLSFANKQNPKGPRVTSRNDRLHLILLKITDSAETLTSIFAHPHLLRKRLKRKAAIMAKSTSRDGRRRSKEYDFSNDYFLLCTRYVPTLNNDVLEKGVISSSLSPEF